MLTESKYLRQILQPQIDLGVEASWLFEVGKIAVWNRQVEADPKTFTSDGSR